MKKFIFIFNILFFIFLDLAALELIKINYSNENELKQLFSEVKLKINYYNDSFVIATNENYSGNYELIDKNAWEEGYSYFLLWLKQEQYNSIEFKNLSIISEILYQNPNFLIIKIRNQNVKSIPSFTHGGIINIKNKIAKLPKSFSLKDKSITYNAEIAQLVAQVDTNLIKQKIQHLQNYGTRNCFTPQAVEAQNWIKTQFENLGLNVTIMDFPINGGNSSDNVIAIKQGMTNPDEYVVIGGHYDSRSMSEVAPGADDNASGTCGVLEVARILSNKSFEKSIIFCAFSGEEYGLYGSDAYAEYAFNNNMNILGYFNLDMIGYRHPGDPLHTDIIAPNSAQPLVNFFTEVANIYVPYLQIESGSVIGGDSDHTSFNQVGYMGIFPFEDSQNYSPYIHTANDLIGPSVNSFELVSALTKANLAAVATMAVLFNGLYPPKNLSFTLNNRQVNLKWNKPQAELPISYKIYRNNQFLATTSDTIFTDIVNLNGAFKYYVTALYAGENGGESNPSNTVTVNIGLIQIVAYDFENGAQNWTIKNTNLGWTWGNQITYFSNNNTNYLSINADAAGYSQGPNVTDYAISPILNLENYENVFIDFNYAYRKFTTDNLKIVYRKNSNDSWHLLENLSATTNFFRNHTVTLPSEALTNSTQIAFFYENNVWAWYAAFDDVKIKGYQKLNIENNCIYSSLLDNYPNPFNPATTIIYKIDKPTHIKIEIYNILGQKIKTLIDKFENSTDINKITWNGDNDNGLKVSSGIYFCKLNYDNKNLAKKLILIK